MDRRDLPAEYERECKAAVPARHRQGIRSRNPWTPGYEGNSMNRIELLYADHYLRVAEECDGDAEVLSREIDHVEAVWSLVQDDPERLFRLLWAVGLFLRYQGMGEEFVAWAGRGREMAQAARDRLTEGQLLNNMGLVLAERGDVDDALRCYEQALAIHEELEDDAELAATLHNLGLLHLDRKGDPAGAVRWFRRALHHALAAGDRAGEAAVRTSLAGAEEVLGGLDAALEQYQEALRIREELGERAALGTTLNHIGSLLLDRGEPDQALEYLLRALPLRQRAGHRRGEAETLDNIAVAWHHKGDHARALEFYHRAAQIAEEVGDRSGLSYILGNVGWLYLERDEPEPAERYLARALRIADEIRDRARRGAVLASLGLLQGRGGDPESGIRFLREALAIAEETDDADAQATALNNLGLVLQETGDVAGAAEAYDDALRVRRARNDGPGVERVLRNLSLLAAETGDAGLSDALRRAAGLARAEIPGEDA